MSRGKDKVTCQDLTPISAHSFDGAVTIEGVEKSDVGKGEVGIDFFEAHSSSRLRDLKELWQKK